MLFRDLSSFPRFFLLIVAVVSGILRLNILVEVLSNPSESFPVALPLKHGAHEHLQGPSVQLCQWDLSKKEITKCLLALLDACVGTFPLPVVWP